MITRARWWAVIGVLVLLVAACGYDDTPLPDKPAAPPLPTAAKSSCTTDDTTLESYDPGFGVPSGPTLDRIIADHKLVVGVSADTYLMGSRNPKTNRLEGFDIEFAQAIGRALFEDTAEGFDVGRDIQYRVITAADRIPLLGGPDAEGKKNPPELDLVIRNFTINCERWDQIDFSAEYYHASQKVLVRAELAKGYSGPQSLSSKKVCAPTGSTSLVNITDPDKGGNPDIVVVQATNHTGCLIKLQQGEVDAITGDDTVLAGLAAQDPYAVVPPPCEDGETTGCQNPLTDEPYGIGVPKGREDLVRFVNYVLEQMTDPDGDGAWQRAYNKWLRIPLGQCTENCQPGDQGIPPVLRYGR
jgi:polar amino acid transport system substrate-binding protein